jgi:hypothetical protein
MSRLRSGFPDAESSAASHSARLTTPSTLLESMIFYTKMKNDRPDALSAISPNTAPQA